MREVVQHHQLAVMACSFHQREPQRLAIQWCDAQAGIDGGRNLIWAAHCLQWHEGRAVREFRSDGKGNRYGQARIAAAAGTGRRQETVIRVGANLI